MHSAHSMQAALNPS